MLLLSSTSYCKPAVGVDSLSWPAFLFGGRSQENCLNSLLIPFFAPEMSSDYNETLEKVKFRRFTPPRRFLPRSAIKLHPIFDLPTTCTLLCYSKPSIIIKLKSMALNFSNIYSPASQWDVNNKKNEGLLHLFLLYINELGPFH